MGVILPATKRGEYIFCTLKNSPTVLCISLIFVLLLVISINASSSCDKGSNTCGLLTDNFIVLKGKIIYYPENENQKIQMIIWDENLNSGVEINIFSDEKFNLGETILLSCKIKFLPNGYNKHLGVKYRTSTCSKEIQIEHNANLIQRSVSGARSFIIEKIKNNYTTSTSSLALGILIGDTTGTPKFLNNDYRSAGILHIVAVSGFNMNIAASALAALIQRARIKIRIIFGLVGMLIYLAIVGFNNIPALRAFICMTFIGGAKLVGRRPNTTYITALVALLLIVCFPGIHDSVSFQLSVLAGFAMSVPLKKFRVLVINLFLLPVLVFNFGSINLLGIFSNFLILPLVTPLTYLIAVYVILPFDFTGLISLIDLIIRAVQNLAGFIGGFSFLNISVESGNYFLVAALVVILIIFIIEVNYRKFRS